MAKCPPGVICFEKFYIYIYNNFSHCIIYFVYSNRSSYKIEMKQSTDTNSNPGGSIFGLFPRPSYSFRM